MKSKKILIIIIIVFVFLVGGASIMYSHLIQNASVNPGGENYGQQGNPAPDFTVYDADGSQVQLSDYIGKPVVLNFWASWCGPCKGEMPEFQDKYLEYGDDVQFLMVNMTDDMRETVGTASKFIANNGYTFPVFYDTESSADTAYIVTSLPCTYFIDADGYVVARSVGAIDAETLQRGIDKIIK